MDRRGLPGSWAEAEARLVYALGGDRPSADWWIREAIEGTWNVSDVEALDRVRRGIALQRLSGVVLRLEDLDEIAFRPDLRQVVAAAFARYFGGFVPAGPPWRVTAYEELPGRSEWVAALDFSEAT